MHSGVSYIIIHAPAVFIRKYVPHRPHCPYHLWPHNQATFISHPFIVYNCLSVSESQEDDGIHRVRGQHTVDPICSVS